MLPLLKEGEDLDQNEARSRQKGGVLWEEHHGIRRQGPVMWSAWKQAVLSLSFFQDPDIPLYTRNKPQPPPVCLLA